MHNRAYEGKNDFLGGVLLDGGYAPLWTAGAGLFNVHHNNRVKRDDCGETVGGIVGGILSLLKKTRICPVMI